MCISGSLHALTRTNLKVEDRLPKTSIAFAKQEKSVSTGNMINFRPFKKGVSILTLKEGSKVKFNLI